MSGTTNWIADATHKSQTVQAQEVLNKLKKQRYTKEKKYELVLVSKNPSTWEEREVKVL